jgi:type III restriction enzyme
LIADEAHHLNSGTKSGNLFGSWEETVLQIFIRILTIFSWNLLQLWIMKAVKSSISIKIKSFINTILSQFRTDKFSKEINLVRSLYDEKERIIQALILNLYRQELATINNINLKPVILFKAKKTIKESEQNKENFQTD